MAGTYRGRRIAFACALAALALPGAAQATVFEVDRFTDAPDTDTGDGVCQTAAPGGCSLRAAVEQANASGGPDVVSLPAGSTSSLTIAPMLSLESELDIVGEAGPRAKIVGSGLEINDYLLRPAGGSDVTLEHVEITAPAGAIVAQSGSPTLTVADSVIKNSARNGGSGGAMNIGGDITVVDSTIQQNTAAFGGGIYVVGGSLKVRRSLFWANTSTASGETGAAIDASYRFGTYDVDVSNTTFVGNTGPGGAVRAETGTLSVRYSTFAAHNNGPNLVVSRDTNESPPPPATAILTGSVIRDGSGAPACEVSLGGTLTGSYNVIGDGTCTGLQHEENGNELGVSDELIGLSNYGEYGGGTLGFALLPGSTAIDHGQADCGLDTDQRGFPRPVGGACDAGAFETQPPPPDTAITAGPEHNAILNEAPVFSFESATGVGFECRTLPDPAVIVPEWAPCESPAPASVGDDGAYVFNVRALDGLGQPDGSPAQLRFVFDTEAPGIEVEAPADRVRPRDAAWTMSGSDPYFDRFECEVDGGGFETCTSPFEPGLGDGEHTVAIRAVDVAGNSSAVETSTVLVDGSVEAEIAAGNPRLEGRKIRIVVGCDAAEAPGSCEFGALKLRTKKKLRVRAGAPRKRLNLGKSKPATVAAGETATLVVKVPRKARGALAAFVPEPAVASVRVTDPVGNPAGLRRGLKIRP